MSSNGGMLGDAHPDPLLEVRGLTKFFPIKKGLFARHVGDVRAVDGVSFDVGRRETLALVGESGCGKTTTGRTILRLLEPTAGSVVYRGAQGAAGADIFGMSHKALRSLRKDLQIIFQDPFASLNPRITVGNIIGEALKVHGLAKGSELDEQVEQILVRVGLLPEARNRFPHEFSGGQRQRIGIARAVVLNPSFIVCDEAVSALDVSIQAQIINLLKDLQEELDLSYLFIAHDLSVVKYIADRIAVMYLGKIVEVGTTEEVFEHPAHPYTKALLSSVPTPDPRRKKERMPLAGDVPTPINPPSGCHFRTRCPVAEPRCAERYPDHVAQSGSHSASCVLLKD